MRTELEFMECKLLNESLLLDDAALKEQYNNDAAYYIDGDYPVICTGMFSEDPIEHCKIQLDRMPKPVPGGIYIDFGCGIGTFLKFIAEKYPESYFIGINVSTVQIEHAKNIGNTASNIDYCIGSFDLVDMLQDNHIDGAWFFQSIGYKPMENTFKSVFRILKKSGFLTIVDVNQTDDISFSESICLKQLQAAWHYSFTPVWYQMACADRSGFTPQLAFLNMNMHMTFLNWNELMSKGLGADKGVTELTPLKVSEITYRK
jgi:SAM-dependent methyltransferase